jgi:hypothetical protein
LVIDPYRFLRIRGSFLFRKITEDTAMHRPDPLQSFSISKLSGFGSLSSYSTYRFFERRSLLICEADKGKLIVVLIVPHRPVSANTVSRLIKSFMQNTGVNTRCFGAHSTRCAVASKVVGAGILVETILRAESWSKESTFNRFYNQATTQTMCIQN